MEQQNNNTFNPKDFMDNDQAERFDELNEQLGDLYSEFSEARRVYNIAKMTELEQRESSLKRELTHLLKPVQGKIEQAKREAFQAQINELVDPLKQYEFRQIVITKTHDGEIRSTVKASGGGKRSSAEKSVVVHKVDGSQESYVGKNAFSKLYKRLFGDPNMTWEDMQTFGISHSTPHRATGQSLSVISEKMTENEIESLEYEAMDAGENKHYTLNASGELTES